MTTRWFSLQRRLLALLLGGVTVGWLAAVGFAYIEAREEVMELLEKRERHGKLEKRVQKELAEHLIESLLSPLLFGLPLLGGWIWFATRRGLAPLDGIAREVGARAPDRLDPVVPVEAPREVRPLLDALNSLFGRVAGALDTERRFTADAAHELRTPLAAIVAQAQVAQRARDDAERIHALDQIATSARRAGRLVEQLLTLARLDPAAGLALATVRLDELAAEVCADHGTLALDKHIALALDAPEETIVQGHADLLRILLRNLLDNALRYTPAGGKVDVGVTAQAGTVCLSVSDSGPGIPAAERANVLRRFHRLAGQEIEGSGLGLSIVVRIAELHQAEVRLGEGLDRDGPKGLAVQVIFRPVRSPDQDDSAKR